MITEPWIRLTEYLNQEDCKRIQKLEKKVMEADTIALKLELEYKILDAEEKAANNQITAIKEVNEFLYFEGTELVGYLGICNFGGYGAPLEVTGMVDPDYRKQGVFTKLYELLLAECKRRNVQTVLLLCDQKSLSGQRFLKKVNATYQNSEYEMYLRESSSRTLEKSESPISHEITLFKSTNQDANEIAYLNQVFFDDPFDDSVEGESGSGEGLLMPEEEEKRGITVYLIKKDNKTIGKIHLQLIHGVGGIYGFGILPEYRGHGYGKATLLEAIAKFKEENANEIMLQVLAENATALNLYTGCGFQETSVMDYYQMCIEIPTKEKR